LRTWFAAQRWGFNTMLAAVRDGRVAADKHGVTEMARNISTSVRATHVQIYKNRMSDVVIANSAIQFRSLRRTLTECCRLDKCQWNPDKPNRERRTHDKGLVLGIHTLPEDAAESSRKRIRANIQLFKGLNTVEVRDRRWLIERLAADVYLRHEAKLHWDKRGGVFSLISNAPPTRIRSATANVSWRWIPARVASRRTTILPVERRVRCCTATDTKWRYSGCRKRQQHRRRRRTKLASSTNTAARHR
jgi:hypothetical protein